MEEGKKGKMNKKKWSRKEEDDNQEEENKKRDMIKEKSGCE